MAAKCGRIEIVRLLIENGSSLVVTDKVSKLYD